MKKTFIALIALAWLWGAPPALAAGNHRVVVVAEGADADAFRQDLKEIVPGNLSLGEASELYAALARNGVKGSVAESLASSRLRDQTLAGVGRALVQTGVPALLSVRTQRVPGGSREIRVILVVKGRAEPAVDQAIALGKGEAAAPRIQQVLAVPLQEIAASTPAEESRGPDGYHDEPSIGPVMSVGSDAPPAKDVMARPRPPADVYTATVVAEAGLEFGTRKFMYSDAVAGPLRAYAAPAIGVASAGVQVYPFAAGESAWKDLAIVGRFALSPTFESKTRDGAVSGDGQWQRWALGVRYRIRLGEQTDAPLAGIEGIYGQWKFAVSGDDVIKKEVPSVAYEYLRLGGDIRLPFGRVALLGGAAFMRVLNAGEFSDKFPHATFNGVEARLGAGYAVLPWLEGRATLAYTRVFASFHPQKGDAYIAGGSLDQFVVAGLGAAALF